MIATCRRLAVSRETAPDEQRWPLLTAISVGAACLPPNSRSPRGLCPRKPGSEILVRKRPGATTAPSLMLPPLLDLAARSSQADASALPSRPFAGHRLAFGTMVPSRRTSLRQSTDHVGWPELRSGRRRSSTAVIGPAQASSVIAQHPVAGAGAHTVLTLPPIGAEPLPGASGEDAPRGVRRSQRQAPALTGVMQRQTWATKFGGRSRTSDFTDGFVARHALARRSPQ